MGSRNTLQVSNVPEISHPSELSFHEEPLWAVSSANTSRGESVLQAAVKEAQQKTIWSLLHFTTWRQRWSSATLGFSRDIRSNALKCLMLLLLVPRLSLSVTVSSLQLFPMTHTNTHVANVKVETVAHTHARFRSTLGL